MADKKYSYPKYRYPAPKRRERDGAFNMAALAEYCGYSYPKMRFLLQSRDFPRYEKTGSTIWIRPEDAQAWLDSKLVNPAA